ncbi:MAG: MBL fold metallo-hydrolase [Thermomicrobiales bacterium]|nr:MBL fold metallo-hydrolase [Thermomicrobiales bacterium]
MIRMYGQGLGDCFLLAFPRTRDTRTTTARTRRPVYVLIDCGAVAGTPDDKARLTSIVADINQSTGGHLDLLVLTHEHWDHLSGFLKAADEWNQITIDALWMAWTELPDQSGLPGALKRILDRQRVALAQIADYAFQLGFAEQAGMARGLISFLGDTPGAGQSFSAAPGVGDALAAAKKLVKEEDHVFCEPGDLRQLPGTDAVCYVLGPPRSDARLRQTNPSRLKETYENEAKTAAGSDSEFVRREMKLADLDTAYSLDRMANDRSSFNALVMPLLGPSLLALEDMRLDERANTAGDASDFRERDIYERSFPFDRSVRIPLTQVESAVSANPGGYPVYESYQDETNHWRRIDFDWLTSAEAFALQADNLTNNTSLVLAIELPEAAPTAKRKVLLFVGDAQVGNWVSWEEINKWRPEDGAKGSQSDPDIADLLGRTVFYKVGHHGSHNATLKAKGVERMGLEGELTAFVPVSVPVAHEVKNWRKMPLPAILDDLTKRGGGRVVLPDGTIWQIEGSRSRPRTLDEIKVTKSDVPLPPKFRERDGQRVLLENEVPLWVQLEVAH